MDDFHSTEATGCVTPFDSQKQQNIFRTIYNYIPTGIILLVLGFVLGVWMANVFHNQKIVDSIKLQRFLHKTIVYNITPNVEINR